MRTPSYRAGERFGGLVLLVALPLTLALSCDGAAFRRASATDTAESYRQYLRRYPAGGHVASAERRLDDLQFSAARESANAYGYHRYLTLYPNGRHTRDARERLAEVCLSRARSVADLETIIERYGTTSAGTRASARLPELSAGRALAQQDEALARTFLSRYPTHPRAKDVRDHLARLVYRQLSDEAAAFDGFASEFSGTREAALALVRLDALLAAEVFWTRSKAALLAYDARFPTGARHRELEQLVAQEALDNALIAVDTARLRDWVGRPVAPAPAETSAPSRVGAAQSNSAAIGRLLRQCEVRPQACEDLRGQARAATPWQSPFSASELRSKVFDPDPETSYSAVTALGLMADRRAGDLLVELVGAPRLSTVWSASNALGTWLRGGTPRTRKQFLAHHLARTMLKLTDENLQRRQLLVAIAWAVDVKLAAVLDAAERFRSKSTPAQAAATAVARGGGNDGRALVTRFVAVYAERLAGRRAPSAEIARLIAAARSRLGWLREAYPDELNDSSLPAARLAERELYALSQALTQAVPDWPKAAPDLERALHDQLTKWQAAIARLPPSASDGTPIDVAALREQAQAHERGRPAALRALWRAKDPAHQLVAAAVCRAHPHEVCAAGP